MSDIVSGSFQRQKTAEVAIVTKEILGPLNRVRLEATGAPISWSVDTIKVTTAERGTKYAEMFYLFIYLFNHSFCALS